jgi:probable HAF family extracellular repeat protein
MAINSSGVVVGQSRDSSGQNWPFMFNGGPMFNLGSFGGSIPECAAMGVNTSGEPVGSCRNPLGYVRAFYFSKGMKDFDPSHITYSSQANAINDSGVAVGMSKRVPCAPHSLNFCEGTVLRPTVFSPNGTIQVLGSLGSGDAWANAINNPGDIVGFSGGHGFIYTNGKLFDLNNWSFRDTSNNPLTGWVVVSADGINDFGQIVGRASDPSGTVQIVLLTPAKFIVP